MALNKLNWKIALAFLDNVLILGTTAETHLDNLRQVFERFRQYGLKFKSKKYEFFLQKVKFLGRSVSSTGVEGSVYRCGKGLADSAECQKRRAVLRLCKLSQELRSSFLRNYRTSVRCGWQSLFLRRAAAVF